MEPLLGKMSCNERGREVGPRALIVRVSNVLPSSLPPSFSCIAASQPPVRPSVRRDWEREPQSKVFRALFSRSHCSLDRQTDISFYSSFTTVLPPQEQKVSRYAFWGTDRSMIMLALTHVRVVALWLSHGSSWGTSLSRQSAFTPFCALHRLYTKSSNRGPSENNRTNQRHLHQIKILFKIHIDKKSIIDHPMIDLLSI